MTAMPRALGYSPSAAIRMRMAQVGPAKGNGTVTFFDGFRPPPRSPYKTPTTIIKHIEHCQRDVELSRGAAKNRSLR
jgi:hypothetical protein